MTRPEIDTLRPKLAGILKKSPFYAEWSKDYPECLSLVILDDVGPDAMEKVCDLLREEGKEALRLCANVIPKDNTRPVTSAFDTGGFDAAWMESWNWTVATVRMG